MGSPHSGDDFASCGVFNWLLTRQNWRTRKRRIRAPITRTVKVSGGARAALSDTPSNFPLQPRRRGECVLRDGCSRGRSATRPENLSQRLWVGFGHRIWLQSARSCYPKKAEFTAVTARSDLAKPNAAQGEQRANSAVPIRSIKPANSSAAPSLISSRCPTS